MKGNERIMLKHEPKISLLMALLVSTLIFAVSFRTIFKVDYNSLSGTLCYVSGSTIKFVDNWLAETPQKLHFVNFESPDSIEFNSLSERGPYISYPSGCTLFVYCAAKLAGKRRVTISFLKHFQMLCFWLEVMLLAIFVCRFLARNRAVSEMERFLIALATATFWSWLPVNAWYLANVYFADQCVILFVMAFLLLEYEVMWRENKSARLLLNIAKSLAIFAGVLTDYYFWILVFVAFVLNIVSGVREKKTPAAIARRSLWYVVPVLLALGFFLYQLTSVPNWRGILKYKFLFRAGIADSEWNDKEFIRSALRFYFSNAFGLDVSLSSLLMLFLVLYLQLQRARPAGKAARAAMKDSITGRNGTVLLLGFVSPALQIVLLKNHSAMHEFSMMKLAWCFAMMPLALSALLCRTIDFSGRRWYFAVSPFFHCFIICFSVMLLITKVPMSSRTLYKTRSGETEDYRLAEILRERARYEHVFFSFSHAIPTLPPQKLAVSGKQVHKITSVEEMGTLFPRLRAGAVKIFVIDKDESPSLPVEQAAAERALMEAGGTFYEDERFVLLTVGNAR